jgi:hypothetical protein
MSKDSNLLQFHRCDACVGSLRSFIGRKKCNFETSRMKVPCTEQAEDASRQDLCLRTNRSIAHDFLVKQMPWIQYMTHLILSSTSRKNTSAAHRTKTRDQRPAEHNPDHIRKCSYVLELGRKPKPNCHPHKVWHHIQARPHQWAVD